MGFTNALFLNTQKQKGKKKLLFGKSFQNPLFPIQNHNQNKWVILEKRFPNHFISKQ